MKEARAVAPDIASNYVKAHTLSEIRWPKR